MRIFQKLYDMALRWAAHRHAPWYLGGLSFSESSFFPIPPDVMLAPMALANPARALHFALLTTVTSVLGGMLGYLIGMWALDAITPLMHDLGWWSKYELAQDWFADWGFWAIFVAGFSPIPYKVFTIAAGAISMAFLPFVAASLIGRGARFFLVAGLIKLGGEPMAAALRRYVDLLGWLTVLAVVVAYLVLRGG